MSKISITIAKIDQNLIKLSEYFNLYQLFDRNWPKSDKNVRIFQFKWPKLTEISIQITKIDQNLIEMSEYFNSHHLFGRNLNLNGRNWAKSHGKWIESQLEVKRMQLKNENEIIKMKTKKKDWSVGLVTRPLLCYWPRLAACSLA